jgi:ankyrin repeat protein
MTLLLLLAAALPAMAGSAELFAAIRAGDSRVVKAQLRDPGLREARNGDGLTPLQYAVLTAGPRVMREVLDAGADVNAATAEGVTALHMAAYDLEKTRLLVSRGANVNAATKAGETPLLVAAARPGAAETVSLLLSKGASVTARAAGGFSGPTALHRAASNADLPLLRLLLASGAKVADAPNIARAAAFGHCRECLRILLDAGAAADTPGRSALQDAAAYGDLEMVRMLVEKGAKVNAADRRGYTALMRAALSYEPGALAVIEYLLAKGASANPKNETGDTALSFAARFGETPAVALLRKHGAPEPRTAVRVPPPLAENTAEDAIKRSLPLLQRIAEPVRKLNSCTTCHNHSLPAMTLAMARSRGFAVDEETARKEFEHAKQPNSGSVLAILLGAGIPDFFPYQLLGIAAGGDDHGPAADGMAHHISTRQDPSGRFHGMDYRPPQEYTDITFTATALRALRLHPLPGRAAEFKTRVERATRWLAAQSPRDNEDHALRLMGLVWGGASRATAGAAARALIAQQRPDGGWSQLAHIAPDAYATGQSLYALHLAGVSPADPAYRKGVEFLLKSQRKDGSWYVTSRTHPVQPLIDGGHPYINHQWISASAGAWSTMALLGSLPAPSARR